MNTLFTIIGGVHLLTSASCMVLGAVMLLAVKGNLAHSKRGNQYFYLMLVTNITALMIYRLDVFFFPHWLAIATLITVLAGYWMASKKPVKRWLAIHIVCMVTSYYMLVGGAINEAFLRIEFFTSLAQGNDSNILGIAHSITMLIFLIIAGYYLIRYRKWEMVEQQTS